MSKRLILLLFALLLCSSCSSKKKKLRIYTWPDYFSHEAIEKFEEEHNCKVIFDLFETNESMYAKLRAGAKGYDLIVPSSYFLDLLSSQEMLEEIRLDLIPNLHYIDDDYLHVIKEIPLNYGIPYMVGISAIGYRQDRLPDLLDTWNIFSNSNLKGRMTMLNDIREVFGAALKYLGYSANTTDPDQIKQATKQLLKWRENLAKFESEQVKSGLANGEFLAVQSYSADIVQVMLTDQNINCLFPKEGSTMSIDCMAIPKGAKSLELVHAFINFMLQPEMAAYNMNTTAHLSPVSKAYPLVEKSLRSSPPFIPSKAILDQAELIRDVGPNIKYYLKAWRRIRDEW